MVTSLAKKINASPGLVFTYAYAYLKIIFKKAGRNLSAMKEIPKKFIRTW